MSSGIGTASGEINLYHLRQGRILFTLNAGDRVTTMSFRTDGHPLLGVGTAGGNILFYHLDTKKRVHIIRDAHREAAGGVSAIQFFNGQPIFVTNGGDNYLSEYVFDPTVVYSNTQKDATSVNSAITSPPRLLRSRGGHSLPLLKYPLPTKRHITFSPFPEISHFGVFLFARMPKTTNFLRMRNVQTLRLVC